MQKYILASLIHRTAVSAARTGWEFTERLPYFDISFAPGHCLDQSSVVDTTIMAPGFDQLSDHDYEDDLENIDFTDLKERYDVRMEEGLDTFVVCTPGRHPNHPLIEAGHRRPPTCKSRSKIKTHQIPAQETKFSWPDKRWRRICFYADE